MNTSEQKAICLGPFELGEQLGSTFTYRGRDTRNGKEVVLRVLPAYKHTEEAVERFRREINAERALSHPNLCQFYEFGECVLDHPALVGSAADESGSGRVRYFAREYLEGRALQWMIRFEPMSVTDAIFVAKQICSGLAAIHAAGLVHRNVTARTVFITEDRRVKITDFGGVKELTDQIKLYRTAPGQVVGSAGYMAPEQFRGAEVDHRSDLFSLGVLVYEMIVGQRPFPEDLLGYVKAIEQGGAFAPLAECAEGVPMGLDALVEKLLEVDPDKRHSCAAEVAAALERFSDQAERDDHGIDGLSLGGWRLDARLGETRTYRAQNERDKLAVVRVAALDGGDIEAVGRYERELEVRRSIEDPSLATFLGDGIEVIDHPEFGGGPTRIGWMACEYFEGESLSTALLYRSFTPTLAIKIALEVLTGLETLHAKGVIHRGVSRRTVFVTTRGDVKLTDLSSVKPLGAETSGIAQDAKFMTVAGKKIGAVGAMAPEQFKGQPVDGRSDLFAVGVLLYELIAGTPPYPIENKLAYIEALSTELPPARLSEVVEDLPTQLDAAVMKLIAYEPDDRYQSASEAISALAGCLAYL